LGRGFFAGILWGAVIGALTIALASQLTGRRELPASVPQRAEVEVPPGSEFNRPRPEAEPVLPEPDAPPVAAAPVAVAEPEPPAAPPEAPGDEPAAVPETALAAPEPAGDVEVPESAGVAGPAAEAPAAPEGAPSAAEAPGQDAAVAFVPEPSPVEAPPSVAQPPAPVAEAVPPAAPGAMVAAPGFAAPGAAPAAPALPPVVLPRAFAPPVAPEVGDGRIALSRPAADAAPGEAAAVAPSAPGADALPSAGAEPPVAPRADAAPVAVPEAPAVIEETEAPEVAEVPEPQAGEEDPPRAAGAPAPGFAGAQGVRVNRLPRIGVEEAAAMAPEAEATPAVPDDAPALLRHAVPFDNPDGRPLVAIVLLHDRPEAPGAGTGADLPVPVSFAVDAGLVEAGAVAAAYRAAGREVLLVPTLPPGAAASDVEVALQVNLDVIPEAVAVMDLPEGGFQAERVAVAQVVEAISASGHGLVTFPRGLNMAQQMAERAGVPARPVFRMIEAGNADAALRTLDQASFRARQEGAVILVGTAEPATVDAIRRWAGTAAAGEVALAPVSAALGAAE
jgi:uncharacterized protein